MHAILSNENFWLGVKWLMVLTIWAILALGVLREDRRIRKMLKNIPSPAEIASLLQMLHQRNAQTWVLISLLLIVSAVNDWHNSHTVVLTPVSAPIAPVVSATEIPAAPTFNKTLPAYLSSGNVPFSDITELDEKNGKQEAYIDWLKERYENWLVTYYYLQKCGQVGQEDLRVILASLQKELDSAHADGAMQSNIMLAATGSYNEMYRDIACDREHVVSTKSAYDANMEQIKNIPQTSPAPAAPVGQKETP